MYMSGYIKKKPRIMRIWEKDRNSTYPNNNWEKGERNGRVKEPYYGN